ncbi:MAG: hypothetical protein IPK17_38960 [Chloroflexi bacterium]|uniref:hypothetical protein n=1 Tax=Candidatus Flexifilum breve TaxID=3140694 RepID=UPI003136D399|nr:hypothetical protein [Chloroflexota bacterium]
MSRGASCRDAAQVRRTRSIRAAARSTSPASGAWWIAALGGAFSSYHTLAR